MFNSCKIIIIKVYSIKYVPRVKERGEYKWVQSNMMMVMKQSYSERIYADNEQRVSHSDVIANHHKTCVWVMRGREKTKRSVWGTPIEHLFLGVDCGGTPSSKVTACLTFHTFFPIFLSSCLSSLLLLIKEIISNLRATFASALRINNKVEIIELRLYRSLGSPKKSRVDE